MTVEEIKEEIRDYLERQIVELSGELEVLETMDEENVEELNEWYAEITAPKVS